MLKISKELIIPIKGYVEDDAATEHKLYLSYIIRKTSHIKTMKIEIAPPGFEPRSKDPKSLMIGHYTTGLYTL